ncbi:hypothetical protein SAMN05216276_1005239 [Streptosporangium subroseum]|uniref:Uncharacterized protein n=1 Tax=Streptosporangium subroseum TaxID=106412 RepID=A0A239CJV3_9ACTN|nr:hypothetical protein [Streptosporangium subroseum]SNS20162.1 hypothetical protein SAMN05216276_1005239 [Streptosporangium subroseum]
MSRFDDLPGYAASIAPLIDAVHLGVHVASRPIGGELVRQSGLQTELMIDLRYVLPIRPLTPEGLTALYRYNPFDRAEIEAQIAQGILVDDGALHATDISLAFIAALYEVHATVTGALWADHADRLPELADLAGRLLAAGADSGGAAFTQASPPYEPEGTPAGVLLFNRLAALRYHRADVHAAVWEEEGFTAAQIIALTPGAVRDRIEAETNRRAAVPYETLTTRERQTLLLGLSALDLP